MSLAVLFFLLFLCFLDMVLLSVLDAVFCARTTVPDKRVRPRAAITILFILYISPYNN